MATLGFSKKTVGGATASLDALPGVSHSVEKASPGILQVLAIREANGRSNNKPLGIRPTLSVEEIPQELQFRPSYQVKTSNNDAADAALAAKLKLNEKKEKGTGSQII
jgi:hypothetical protein